MTLTEADAARTVQTKDWKLRYYEAGEGNDKTVVLLHGGGPGATGWSNYAPNIEPLAEKLHVLAVDMPGWGESDPVDFANLDHIEAATQFLDALGIEQAAFVGNSMGGHTSIRLAAEHPERVSHLITMGPPVTMRPILFGAGDGPSEGLKVMYQAYRDPSPENMKRLVEIMVFDSAKFGTPELAKLRSDAALQRPDHLANVVKALPRSPIPIWVDLDAVSGITAPTLLIHGRDDRVVSFETSLMLCARIANSRVSLLNRCGHWAQIEHADVFNRLVADFVLND